MHKLCVAVALCVGLGGCVSRAEWAKEDDAKCQSYGAKVGDPAYVSCRAQLDAARTGALSRNAAAGGLQPFITP